MKRLLKAAAALAALLVALVVVLVLLVRVLVTPERVKAVVVPLAESALQRKVTLGGVRIGLFSGIVLHDLAIAERSSSGRLLTVERARLRFQWLPLLARRVIIDEVLLERPVVAIGRDAGGALSIDDLLVAAGGGTSGAAPPKTDSEFPISLLLSDVQVAAGRLEFTDHATDGAPPVVIELTELDLAAAGFVLDGSLPLRLSGQLNGAPLAIDGTLRLRERGGRLNIDLQQFDARTIAPYLRARLPGRLEALTLDLKAEVDSSPQGVTAKGTLIGGGLTLRLAAAPAVPLENAVLRANFDLASHPQADELEVRRLSIDYNGLQVGLDGRVQQLSSEPRVDATLTTPGIDLRQAMTALPAGLLGAVSKMAPSGLLRGELHLSGALAVPRQLPRRGHLLLEQVQGTVAGVRPSVNGRLLLADGNLRIERLTAGLGALVAEVTGGIDHLDAEPVMDLVINLPRVDLATALAEVPPELAAGAAGLALSGKVAARARLAGPLVEPKGLLQAAELTLAGVQLSTGGQRPEFNGRVRLAGEQLVTEELTVLLGGNTAQLKGTLRNLFGKPLIATLDVTAHRFQVQPLLQGSGTAAAATGKLPAPAPDGEFGPFDLPLQANGTFRIDETTWQGLAVNDFHLDYALKDNQLALSRVTGRIAGGTFNNSARIDLRQPGLAYSTEFALQGVRADALLAALAPAATGTVFGTLELQGTLRGRGTRWETARDRLAGEGVLQLADGRLASPALVGALAGFLQLSEGEPLSFRDFRGTARVAGGRLEIDSALVAEHIKLFPKGTLGLDGTLDLAVDARLGPELAGRLDQRGQLTRYLVDADGWSQVPLLLTGTLHSPRVGLDPQGIKAQAGRALQQQLQRGIDRLRNRAPPPAVDQPPAQQPAGQETAPETPPTSPPKQPQRKLLDDTLQQLLGR